MKTISKLCFLAILAFASPQTAVAASEPQYPTFWKFPDCDAPFIERQIVERSNWAERTTFNYGVELQGFNSTQERVVETFGLSPIFRRYCRASGNMSDGKNRTVYYRISRGMGLAGTGYSLEFCIQGLDRWRVFDGNCRVLQR